MPKAVMKDYFLKNGKCMYVYKVSKHVEGLSNCNMLVKC